MNTKTLNQLSFAGFILAASFFVGCQSYTAQNKATATAWQSGNVAAAAIEQQQKADGKEGSKDELLLRLELGAIHRAAGDTVASIEAFDKAEEVVNKYEEEAKVRLGSETAALFTNQAALPYRGQAYEKIMMNTYKSLNYLQLNDFDNARIELNRALNRQENAVIENQKKIEEALEVAEKSASGELSDESGKAQQSYNVGQAQTDPKFAGATQTVMAEVDSRILPYSDYVNPFTVFVDGLYFSQLGINADDIERARKSFERVKSMSPGTYIQADYEMAEAMANGAEGEKVTYVIFSTGSAPTRDEIRIDIPLFLISSVSYVGASFPKLEYHSNFIPTLTATTSEGTSYNSELLSSMDAVISKDFKNAWPTVLTKTLISSGAKAMAGYMAEKAVENQDWKVRLIAKAANIGLQAATNRADLRSWSTLPKQFSYIRIPTPEDGIVNLSAGLWQNSVTVEAGKSNVVYVRSINDVALPLVSQFALEL